MPYRAYNRYINDSRYLKPRRTTYLHRRRPEAQQSSQNNINSVNTFTPIQFFEDISDEDEISDSDNVADGVVDNTNEQNINEQVIYMLYKRSTFFMLILHFLEHH